MKFLVSHHITRLVKDGGTVNHVEVTDPEGHYQRLSADSYVLAAGSFSALLAGPLRLNLPIYPVKGYSVTLPVVDANRAYETSLTDSEFMLVFSRYTTSNADGSTEDRLRIAGTAELADIMTGRVREVDFAFAGQMARSGAPVKTKLATGSAA